MGLNGLGAPGDKAYGVSTKCTKRKLVIRVLLTEKRKVIRVLLVRNALVVLGVPFKALRGHRPRKVDWGFSSSTKSTSSRRREVRFLPRKAVALVVERCAFYHEELVA